MKVAQKLYNKNAWSSLIGDTLSTTNKKLVLGFGSKALLQDETIYKSLENDYAHADIVLCSTAGEIYNDAVFDNTVSVVIMEFDNTPFTTFSLNIKNQANSFEAGKTLFNKLNIGNLSYVLIISDGGLVNGSELVRGIEEISKGNIPITGGLAGDDARFIATYVGHNQQPAEGNIVAIGFYGNHLKIGHGSVGGWDIFGPEKKVTKSQANKLYEIDDSNALDLYKKYLGKYADELPGSALLFPLCVRQDGTEGYLVRTILSINNEEKVMVFAGDIPEGSYVRFMKANFDKIIDAANQAATNTFTQFNGVDSLKPKLALLISCVGRKLILGSRIDEEIEAVKDIFGNSTLISGFYSYGEISPLNPKSRCELNNQTMTITTFNE
ncbi:MAG: FIST C-terminal domain-containing protein [Deinococcales bacterium]|nr:FIST C-terminal domain-containing protein [Chitinophagaceae bacterium]